MPAPAWVAIQESTFTRWVHVQLGTDADGDGDVDAGKASEGLADVFKTGTNLIKILEKVTGKGIGKKYKESPKIKLQELENLNIAFNFMENEGVKLVNITGEDIWNGSLKLILGMIWTIIYQFQVSRMDIDGKKNPKEALLQWIQSKIPDYDIKNLNGDWKDGRAVCALTQALGKELYDGEDVIASIGSPAEALENARRVSTQRTQSLEFQSCSHRRSSHQRTAMSTAWWHTCRSFGMRCEQKRRCKPSKRNSSR